MTNFVCAVMVIPALAAKDEPDLAIQFIEVTEADYVRTEGRKHQHKRMYRQSSHLSDIVKAYEDQSADDLRGRLRASKAFDTQSCSESCEIFQLEG